MTSYSYNWCCYLLLCSKDQSLYCGITNDLCKRLEAHETGKGAKYTKGRGPFRLVAVRTSITRKGAATLEAMVKRQPKDKKITFMKTFGRPPARKE